jgi:hypothetical protein
MPSPGDGDRFAADLARWLADARVDEAATSRARERWLRQQAGEEATVAGLLLDLAERAEPVLVEIAGGRRHRSVVRGVAADFCALTGEGGDVLVAYAGITSVQTMDGDEPTGDRPHALDMTFAEALSLLVAERPRVLVTHHEGTTRTGELRSVGRDVVLLRADGGSQLHVPIASIAAVTLTD